jgi:nucleoside-diphosphate-sugar epimerase
MRILVTGGTGFVGRYLVNDLIRKGAFIRLLVRAKSDIKFCKNNDIELFFGDITDRNSLKGAANNIDVVYHLAAKGHVSAASEKAYLESYEVNVNGTRKIMDECLRAGVRRFIHFSSTAAMGLIKDSIIDERAHCVPSTPYQKSKFESERIVIDYQKKKGLPGIILRPCMIYGVGGTGEFHKWCKLIKKGLFPKIGKNENLTPMVHVKDVVQAAILASGDGREGETYLIASNHSYELKLIRDLAAKHMNAKIPYFYVPKWIAMTGAMLMENVAKWINFVPVVTSQNIRSITTGRVFSIAKAETELGYRPNVDLSKGIKETVQWYLDQKIL